MLCVLFNLTIWITLTGAHLVLPAAAEPPKNLWPDVYPSHSSAAQGVAEQIAVKLQNFPQHGSTIFIRQESGNTVSNEVIKEMSTAIAARFPTAHVQIDRTANPAPTTAPTVEISGSEQWYGSADNPEGDKGEIIATLSGPTAAMFHGKFDYKRWVDDFSSFVNSQPSITWLVGRSNHFCASIAQADDSARDDLADQLAADIQKRLSNVPNHQSDAAINSRAHDIVRGIQVNDKFLQRFDSPTGPVWQESILYNSNNQDVASFITFAVQGSSPTSEFFLKGIKPAIGLVIVILVLYAFLNWITKGYFSTRLKIAAMLVLVIGAALVFLALFTQHIVHVNVAASDENRIQAEDRQQQLMAQERVEENAARQAAQAKTQQ